ncbi:GH1 family beta-glucosidase [Flaviramulus sp. BrNp1-15]|uniref:GH1 family beta-glucosidase n=1 Tax=Flaviramulus sp. BrNp1-15 TaxID=2916754 RepID=UPI001EE86F19|nr:GH1 family beta-glucosidase [Flaviramulus sp. BrNp1-15]ULC60897.1 GH1 family beta-glucosidase [Flaviramulus sp. BrNp1-15]
MIKFSNDFIWGTATSAYQIEGGHNADGKGPSIWDSYCTIPNRIKNNENGNVAIDHYNRYKEDVALLKSQGFKAYRFSISWSRIMPEGKGKINEEGILFYSNLIDELLKNDITPWVTLYHWDLPLALEMENDGWLNPDIADYFEAFAKVCFERFGDRVKNWITLNEPWVAAILGYGQGVFAPGRTSNSEPYLAAHHLILAHAKAVKQYRTNFNNQKGTIGITNNCDWREPLTDKLCDIDAAERALLFFIGWFADPVYFGDYPQVMKDRLGERLPKFTEEEKELIKDSSDFFGLNHYTTMYAAEDDHSGITGSVYGNGGISEDQDVILSQDESWPLTSFNWAVVPWGCYKLLDWISKRYNNPDIIITENGFACDDKVENGEVNDLERLDYYKQYLEACNKAIADGINLKGYFAWSLFDNFEWASGYSVRFGINYIDYKTLKRIPKASALWFKQIIKNNGW